MTSQVPGCGTVSTTTSVTVNICRDAETYDPTVITGTEIEANQSQSELHGKSDILSDESAYTFTIWPNPNEGSKLNLKWTGLSDADKDITVKVFDATGKAIQVRSISRSDIRQSSADGILEFPVRLAKGVYTIEAVHDGVWRYERLIVE
jgi:hypothetical protein